MSDISENENNGMISDEEIEDIIIGQQSRQQIRCRKRIRTMEDSEDEDLCEDSQNITPSTSTSASRISSPLPGPSHRINSPLTDLERSLSSRSPLPLPVTSHLINSPPWQSTPTQRKGNASCPGAGTPLDQELLQSSNTKQLLIMVLENQKEILTRLRNLESKSKDGGKTEEKVQVPPGLRNAVKNGYIDGEKKGFKWYFEGKSDPTILNAALARYFLTKKQDDSYRQKDKKELEKKKRATYERKKEKSKRRKIALEKTGITNEGKKTKIRNVLTPLLMSSDEETEGGFITHQPSWQSEKFKIYKEKLDKMYKEICSKKSRNMLQNRTIGEIKQMETPELTDDQKWILRDQN